MATQSRKFAIKQFDCFYRKKFRWSKTCVYCGQPATDQDHVYPISLLSMLNFEYKQAKSIIPFGLYIVPACRECNSLAASQAFFSVLSKRDFIKSKLRLKYHKIITTVMWDEEEIAELGRNLQADVRKMLHNRNVVEARLNWPRIRT